MSVKDRKRMNRQQTMGYFINAAIEIIDEKGLAGLSIRNTADRAGYNSATLYHYFSDFEELCIFAAMEYLDKYAKDLPLYIKEATRPLESYLKVWECFCYHSFSHPDVFWLLFFKHADKNWDFSYYFKTYYEIFPENWIDELNTYESMLSSANFTDRERLSLSQALEEEDIHLSDDAIASIVDMSIMLYRGMLETFREEPDYNSIKEATADMVLYLRKILTAYEINL